MIDQYRYEQHGNSNCFAFMITTAEYSVVDYRGQWQWVGNGILKPANKLLIDVSKISNPSRFHSLQETN